MANLVAAFVVLLKLPFLLLGLLLKRRALLIVLVVIVLGIGAYQTLHKSEPETITGLPIPYYQEKEPDVKDAPYVIQTVSPDRVYYAGYFADNGQTILLLADNFYMYNKNKWEIGKLPLYLERRNFSDIRIYQR